MKGTFLTLALAACTAAQSVLAAAPDFVPERVLVIPKVGKSAETEKAHRAKGRRVLKKFEGVKNLQVVELRPGEDVFEAVQEYKTNGNVEAAEPDYILKASVIPNDPQFAQQWGLHNTGQIIGVQDSDMDAPEAWDTLREAPDVIVAIIDSGIRTTHEDLRDNLWRNPREIANGRDDDGNGYIDDIHGINAMHGTGDPTDVHGHGTHVAGIIGAAANNGVGIAGTAWKVQLMSLRFMDADGYGTNSDAIECIDYARKNGAKVMNASFGSSAPSFAMKTAIQAARNAGIVFAAAAGNETANNDVTWSFPANFTTSLDNVVSVAASTQSDARASFSNWGLATVDVAAPGSMILSCGHDADDSYLYMGGTSMATPYVAGVIALMSARFPGETPAQLIERLRATVDPLPAWAGLVGSGGRVNLARAVALPPVELAIKNAALEGGEFRFEAPDAAGRAFAIEASSDLGAWTEVARGTAGADGVVRFAETVLPEGSRFFRASVR